MNLIERKLLIVSAPILPCDLVPDALLGVGIGSPWPERNGRRTREIYIGERSDGLIKIGCSTNPAWRVFGLKLAARLFIEGTELAHEAALHAAFTADRVERELFRPERVLAFVCAAAQLTTSTLSDCGANEYFVKQVEGHLSRNPIHRLAS